MILVAKSRIPIALMDEHEALLDRANLAPQRTEVRGTWAQWEYGYQRFTLGDAPAMRHVVVDCGLRERPPIS